MRCLKLRIVGEGRCAWSRLRNPLLVTMAPHLRTHTKGFRAVPREMRCIARCRPSYRLSPLPTHTYARHLGCRRTSTKPVHPQGTQQATAP